MIEKLKELAKTWNRSAIYFHIDLDGVTSAIAMKECLEYVGIPVVGVIPIQYGGLQYLVPKTKSDVMDVLVDFSAGKPNFIVHTDHHLTQSGVGSDTVTLFEVAKSNASTISTKILPEPIFSDRDIEVINMIDSADYFSYDLKATDVTNALVDIAAVKDLQENRVRLGLIVNKLILSYKNKPNFLQYVVMSSEPDLESILDSILTFSRSEGLKTIREIAEGNLSYIEQQKGAMSTGSIDDVVNLKSGNSVVIDDRILAQYDGGKMFNGYDRFVPFINAPQIDYLCLAWSLGSVQVSCNPFKNVIKDDISGIVSKVMEDIFKSELEGIDISMEYIKSVFERGNEKNNIVGFTYNDAVALYGLDKIKNINTTTKPLLNKLHKNLSNTEKGDLKGVTISAWDAISSQSGGHKSIYNIAGINLLGKGYVDLIYMMMHEITKQLLTI